MCFILLTVYSSCKNEKDKEESTTYESGTFGYDLNFLKKKDSSLVVLQKEESRVIVSPKYQAKVFTSSSKGNQGRSYGWINYEAFDGEEDSHMNAYGGENRLWLGPEGSKFSLFFKPGSEMVFENWKTPAPIDTEAWKVLSQDSSEVEMTKEMSLMNYSETPMEIRIDRKVKILNNNSIKELLTVDPANLQSVGYTTYNSITNIGENSWNKETGAPSIWILDMFKPSENTVVVIPYNESTEESLITTDYFGEIPEERIIYNNGFLFFKADGRSRGKLGISPKGAKNIAGSYDPLNQLLTITKFEVDSNAVYLNQEWSLERDPLKGDAVNAYNDGPLEDGSQMGPFYEIESVSPAAFLKPKETLSHKHSVFHFSGSEDHLDKISKKLLGVSIKEIKNSF